ncbi:unnamed protein product [Urochloa humidicola]
MMATFRIVVLPCRGGTGSARRTGHTVWIISVIPVNGLVSLSVDATRRYVDASVAGDQYPSTSAVYLRHVRSPPNLYPNATHPGSPPAGTLAVEEVLRREILHVGPGVRERVDPAAGEGDEVHADELVVAAAAGDVLLRGAWPARGGVAVPGRADAADVVDADGDADAAGVTGATDGAELLDELPYHVPPPGLWDQAVEPEVAVVVEREATHPVLGALVGGDELRGRAAAELEDAVVGEVEQGAAAADVGVDLAAELQRRGFHQPVAAARGLERRAVAGGDRLPRHERVDGLREARPRRAVHQAPRVVEQQRSRRARGGIGADGAGPDGGVPGVGPGELARGVDGERGGGAGLDGGGVAYGAVGVPDDGPVGGAGADDPDGEAVGARGGGGCGEEPGGEVASRRDEGAIAVGGAPGRVVGGERAHPLRGGEGRDEEDETEQEGDGRHGRWPERRTH